MVKTVTTSGCIEITCRLCDPIEQSVANQLDMPGLYQALASNFAEAVQINRGNITIDKVRQTTRKCTADFSILVIGVQHYGK